MHSCHEPCGNGNFYYVMILLFLLISNLITKYRHSYSDSHVRSEGRRIRKKNLIRKSSTMKPWQKGSVSTLGLGYPRYQA
jgi:hypothetical protein